MYGDKMEKIRFQICEKELTLYPAQGEDRPLIVFNTVMGDGKTQALRAMDARTAICWVVGKLQWYHDMTPELPAARSGARLLRDESGCLSGDIGVGNRAGSQGKSGKRAVRWHRRVPRWLGFLRSMMYRCDCFARVGQHVRLPVVSVPGIRARRHELMRQPEMSLYVVRDAEAKTKHAVLKNRAGIRRRSSGTIRMAGVDVRWELNPEIIRDVAMRSAKGIKAILEAETDSLTALAAKHIVNFRKINSMASRFNPGSLSGAEEIFMISSNERLLCSIA